MLLDFYTKVQTWFVDLRERARSERGASAVEYGLLVALIAAIIVLVVQVVGEKTSNAFDSVAQNLP